MVCIVLKGRLPSELIGLVVSCLPNDAFSLIFLRVVRKFY
jgi:hypothetical protein